MTSTVRLTSVSECIEQLNTLLNMNSKTEDGLTMRRSGSLTLRTEWEGKYFFIKYVRDQNACYVVYPWSKESLMWSTTIKTNTLLPNIIVGDDRRKMIEKLKKILSHDVSSITTFHNNNNNNDNINNDNDNKIIIIIK